MEVRTGWTTTRLTASAPNAAEPVTTPTKTEASTASSSFPSDAMTDAVRRATLAAFQALKRLHPIKLPSQLSSPGSTKN